MGKRKKTTSPAKCPTTKPDARPPTGPYGRGTRTPASRHVRSRAASSTARRRPPPPGPTRSPRRRGREAGRSPAHLGTSTCRASTLSRTPSRWGQVGRNLRPHADRRALQTPPHRVREGPAPPLETTDADRLSTTPGAAASSPHASFSARRGGRSFGARQGPPAAAHLGQTGALNRGPRGGEPGRSRSSPPACQAAVCSEGPTDRARSRVAGSPVRSRPGSPASPGRRVRRRPMTPA